MQTVTAKHEPHRQLFQFFALTFLFSWFMWLPSVVMSYGWVSSSNTLIAIANVTKWVAGMGPSLAAIYLIARRDGRSGVSTLLKRVISVRLGYWYIPTVMLLPVVLVVAHLLNIRLLGGSFPQTGLLSEPWWIPVVLVIFIVMQLGEELGWRGYALERLQQRWSALLASIVLGSAWAVWHIPMFLANGFGQHDYHLPFGQFWLTLVLMSVIMTWLQNNTNNSLAPALIVHASINLSGEVLPLIEKSRDVRGNYSVWVLVNVLLFFVVAIVVRLWGYKRLPRH